jgi:hypothetical protein
MLTTSCVIFNSEQCIPQYILLLLYKICYMTLNKSNQKLGAMNRSAICAGMKPGLFSFKCYVLSLDFYPNKPSLKINLTTEFTLRSEDKIHYLHYGSSRTKFQYRTFLS